MNGCFVHGTEVDVERWASKNRGPKRETMAQIRDVVLHNTFGFDVSLALAIYKQYSDMWENDHERGNV